MKRTSHDKNHHIPGRSGRDGVLGGGDSGSLRLRNPGRRSRWPGLARKLQILAIALLMLPGIPSGSATHLGPDQPDDRRPPQVSTEPLIPTGAIPVDDTQKEVLRGANDASNRSGPYLREAYRQRNQTVDEVPALGFITLLKEGFGPNETQGGFGPWAIRDAGEGVEAWNLRDRDGTVQTGVLAKGYYPGSARSLLVSPELDLRTGFVDPVLKQPTDDPAVRGLLTALDEAINPAKLATLPERPIALSAIYRLIFAESETLLNSPCLALVQSSCVGAGQPLGADAEPRDGLFLMEFERRFNLANGRDGVQIMAFTRPPTFADAGGCRYATDDPTADRAAWTESLRLRKHTAPRQTCTLLHTFNRDHNDESLFDGDSEVYMEDTASSVGGPAYNGYDGWRRDFVDLTPWAGQSVWVAFYFTSGSAGGDNYFGSRALFDTAAGFYGFELDNVSVTAPAPEHSLRVRPLLRPAPPREETGRTEPAVALHEPLVVEADIINMGSKPLTAALTLRVFDRGSSVPRVKVDLGTLDFKPGEAHRVRVPVDNLTEDRAKYTLELRADTVSTPAKSPEADPSDNLRVLDFEVEDFSSLHVGDTLTRSSPTIPKKGVETFELLVENLGNVPLGTAAAPLRAEAQVIEAETGGPAPYLTIQGEGAGRAFTLAPAGEDGSSAILNWSVLGDVAGQYRLFVRVNDERPYDETEDFRQASVGTRALWNEPDAIDGVVAAGEWPRISNTSIEMRDPYVGGLFYSGTNEPANAGAWVYERRLASGAEVAAASVTNGQINWVANPLNRVIPGTLGIANNGTRLFLALTMEGPANTPPFLGVFFDDGADGDIAFGKEDGVLAYNDGTKVVALDLVHVDNGLLRSDDVRLSPLGDGSGAFRELAGGPDAGRRLSDFGAPRVVMNGTTTPAVPRELFLDLDGSGTVSQGDYQVASDDLRHAGKNGAVVIAGDPRLGSPVNSNELSVPQRICFLDKGAGGRTGLRDAGEPVYLAVDCDAIKAGDLRLSPAGDGSPGGRFLVPGRDPEFGAAATTFAGTTLPFQLPAFRFNDNDGDGRLGGPEERVYLQTWGFPWIPDPQQDWTVAAQPGPPGSKRFTYEFAGPLSGMVGDLQAGPGGKLRLMASHLGDEPYSWPSVSLVDGHGFKPANGNFSDESLSWAAIDLVEAPRAVGGGERRLSLGFGVDRSPPVIYEESLDGCAMAGWVQTSILPAEGVPSNTPSQNIEKWSCAPYGPDGRERLYEGWGPQAICDGKPCPQWSAALEDRHPASFSGDATPNRLLSPPLKMPEVANPYLILRHQYSTETVIDDDWTDAELAPPINRTGIMRPGINRAFVQVFDEFTQRWEDPVLLKPDGGFPTEETLSILDFSRSQRKMVQEDSKWPCVTREQTNVNFVDKPCGWWWPTGAQPDYQAPGEPIVTGGTFHGSPWTVDHVPLFGPGHGFAENHTLDLAGRTVRLIFESYPSLAPDPEAEVPADHGWRIEGLAITEGPTFSKDVAVAALSVLAPLYDPVAVGLGPGTQAAVNVTLSNEGSQPATGLGICLRIVDLVDPALSGQCEETPLEGLILASGQRRSVVVPFDVPDRPGAVVSLQARVSLASGDDFTANNDLRTAEAFPIQAAPDLAIRVSAVPRTGTTTTPRTLEILLENRGNVPLTNFTIERSVVLLDGNAGGSSVLPERQWTVNGTLGIGQARTLSSLQTKQPVMQDDLKLPAPRRTGTFILIGRANLADDADSSNNVAAAPFQALDALYSNFFDAPSALDATTLDGTPGVWNLQPGSQDGSQRLVAQDSRTREIPLRADSSIELPPLDLGSAKGATLTFRHRYDLEEAFDAGRVEVSTDNGTTWRLLRPVPTLQTSLGYPDVTLAGTSAFAGDHATHAIAYTGRSDQVPGAPADGWVDAEFDLAQDPGLSRRAAVDSFVLTNMARDPAPAPMRSPLGETQFRSSTWVLGEEEDRQRNELAHRYWWIQNLTYDSPQPHSGATMWWSGTAGQDDPGDRPESVRNRLDHSFPAPASANGAEILATWWEWRAGWTDGGTGARYTVGIVGHPDREVVELASEPSGWRQRGIDVDGLPGPLTLRFDYDSVASGAFSDPRKAKNLGWFVDDFQVVAYQVDGRRGLRHSPQNVTGLEDLEAPPAAWETSILPGNPVPAQVMWTLSGAAVASQDGGWHVGEAELPGQGKVSVWRFSKENEQGYPHLAESRLVTPLVDLGLSSGGLRLSLDQRYWFETSGTNGQERCPLDETVPSGAAARQGAGCFRSAVDGGAIEYQLFDPASNAFGPWRQLAARPEFPERLLLESLTDNCAVGHKPPHSGDSDPPQPFGPCHDHARKPDRLSDLEGNLGRISSTGYSAIEERGVLPEFNERLTPSGACDIQASSMTDHAAGHGSQFEQHPALVRSSFELCKNGVAFEGESHTDNEVRQPWRSYPVSYVFSGPSGGIDGWERLSWDVSQLAGKQVRFAFHASTNPGYVQRSGDPSPCGPTGSGPQGCEHRGWSLANIAVEGNAFEGKTVRLRLRVATDSSVAAGEWSIDNLTVSGERYEDNAALLSAAETVEAAIGEAVLMEGKLANLGNRTRAGLVLGLTALRADDLQPFDDDLEDAQGVRVLAPGNAQWVSGPLPSGVQAAFPVRALEPGDSEPIRVEIDLPSDPSTVLLRWTLLHIVGDLEDGGDDGPTLTSRYEPLILEVPGNAVAEWRAVAADRPRIVLTSGVPGRSGAILAEPGAIAPGADVLFSSFVENLGTSEPRVVADWAVEKVVRKGSPQQPGTGQERTDPVVHGQPSLCPDSERPCVIHRGDRLPTVFSFTAPDAAGLYRATLRVLEGDHARAEARFEFLVGQNGTYHSTDFATANATQNGWTDQSGNVGPDGGGSPDWLRFRDIGGRLRWGVSPEEYALGITYCPVFDSCNSQAEQGQTSIGRKTGFEGIAVGPRIDLSRVPQGRAFVTLRHDVNLELGDGAHLEAIPLDSARSTEETAVPAFRCADNPAKAMSFTLFPEHASDYGAVVRSNGGYEIAGSQYLGIPDQQVPARINPLIPDVGSSKTAMGGLAVDATARFALDQLATSTCPGANGRPMRLNLVNYTILPVLRTGSLPGYRTINNGPSDIRIGAEGWSVRSIHVSSASLEISPASERYSVRGGAAKEFVLTVRNAGEVQDEVEFLLDANRTNVPDPAWIRLPDPVTLAAGETRRVAFTIAPPAGDDLQTGVYSALVMARARSDAGLVSTLDARIDIVSRALPDLDVRLATETEGSPPTLQSDTVEVLRADIINQGDVASRPVDAVLEFAPASSDGAALGPFVEVGRALVPEIPPSPRAHQLSFEWPVPSAAGPYLLRLAVDPQGRLIEKSRSNNAQLLAVDVVPFAVADVAITALQVDGLRPDGMANEGSQLVFTAYVSNLGTVTAGAFVVRMAVAGTPNEWKFASLAPGQTINVTASMLAVRGEAVVHALVISKPDGSGDNNDARRSLRVIGHTLDVQPVAARPSLAAGQASPILLNLTNEGNAIEKVSLRLDPTLSGWAFQSPNPITVLPGQSVLVETVIVPPAAAAAGARSIGILVTPGGDAAAATTHPVPVLIEPRPGAPILSADLQPSAPAHLRLPILLKSSSNLPQDLTVRLLSPRWPSEPSAVALSPGGDATLQLPVEVPASTPPGLYLLTLRVSPADGAAPMDHAVELGILPGPSLAATWSGAVRTAAPALGVRSLAYTLRLVNDGNVPVVPQVQLRGLPPGTTAAPADAGPALAPGEERLVTVDLTMPADAVEAVVGQADVLMQQEGGSSIVAGTLDLPRLDEAPNLRILRMDVTPRSGFVARQPIRIAATVENQGSVEAPPSILYVSANGYLVQPVDLPAIAAGGSAPVNVTVAFDRSGSFILLLQADAEGTVAELQDGDNGMSVALEVAKPRLDDRIRGAPQPAWVVLTALAAVALALRRRKGAP
ncbi:MAG TPA: CARDB domain-containing protein [Candidatus Thermoplasmatota archaeon]|nr:CARDB domain-containing protein [Candidatus Thermoplasmatota archaeon]